MPKLALALLASTLPALASTNPDWTTPLPPFQIADHLFYVGSRDLAAFLITTRAGDILINENLPSSPAQILASLHALGVEPSDIKLLLCSHAHFDHIGGAAELRRITHAQFALMDADVAAAQSGGRLDPTLPTYRYTPVPVDRVLHDGDPITLGGVTITALKTPGHTPGTTTFLLTTALHGKPERVVIVGSWSALDEYRLVASPGHPTTYPGIATDFEHTFQTLAHTHCDVFLAAHGTIFDLLGKLPRAQSDPTVWIDPAGYQAAVAAARTAFEHRLAQQQAANPDHPRAQL